MIKASVHSQLSVIAQQFPIFECVPCAIALRQFLIDQNISGKQIKPSQSHRQPRRLLHCRIGFNCNCPILKCFTSNLITILTVDLPQAFIKRLGFILQSKCH